ncbi:MAG: flagellar filament capping protein FliD, partial [Balneolaceae bacterium]
MIVDHALFSNPYESSIKQIMQIEGQKKAQLQDQRSTLTDQKTALSDIDSKLSALNTLLTSFTDSPSDKLSPLTGTSSNPDAVSIVSTSGLNNPGSYNIDITQKAKEDIVLSDAISQSNTDYNANGTGSFDLSIGSGTATTINVNTSGLNNQEVLEAIAAEVNGQLGDQLNASVYKLGDGTSKLSFKSKNTGQTNRINITNQQGDLSSLNLTHQKTASELDAKFTIDGVSFQRSSNLIDDTVQGLTFEIHDTTTNSETLNIERDTDEARKNIEDFIDKFNEANKILRDKTFLNGKTGERGILQKERSVRNLSFNLRNAASQPVSSLSGSPINTLRNIGIELNTDGSMKIADSDALDSALKQNPDGVANLFSA